MGMASLVDKNMLVLIQQQILLIKASHFIYNTATNTWKLAQYDTAVNNVWHQLIPILLGYCFSYPIVEV